MTARLIHVILLIAETAAFADLFPKQRYRSLKYYTQLSNLCALGASALYLILGEGAPIAAAARYLTTCMLTLTCLIVLFVLIPMGEPVKEILWSKHHGFLYHLAAPVLSFVSYAFFEPHPPVAMLAVPVGFTVVYGALMLILNGRRRITGPYPFFEVHKQSPRATVVWMCVLITVVTAIDWALIKI